MTDCWTFGGSSCRVEVTHSVVVDYWPHLKANRRTSLFTPVSASKLRFSSDCNQSSLSVVRYLHWIKNKTTKKNMSACNSGFTSAKLKDHDAVFFACFSSFTTITLNVTTTADDRILDLIMILFIKGWEEEEMWDVSCLITSWSSYRRAAFHINLHLVRLCEGLSQTKYHRRRIRASNTRMIQARRKVC